jgi:alpha-glucosidase
MPWLPIPQNWKAKTVQHELQDEQSSLSMYQSALALRKHLMIGTEDFSWTITPDGSGVIAFKRGTVEVVLNTSDAPVKISTLGRILIASSGQIQSIEGSVEIAPKACIWLTI